MPYAINGRVSTETLSGAILITDAQYAEAIDGMLAGKVITIDGGFAVIDPPKPVAPIPPSPTLDEAKTAQHAQINHAFDQAAQAMLAGYPLAEILTWPTQQTEALAWGADNTTPTPYLDGIAAARGVDPAEMRTITLAQVQTFQAASQQLVGTRQKLRDEINAAGTITDVQAIVWPA